jgi:hypothetical protein
VRCDACGSPIGCPEAHELIERVLTHLSELDSARADLSGMYPDAAITTVAEVQSWLQGLMIRSQNGEQL